MGLSRISQFKLPLLEKAFAVCPSAILITNIDDTILAVNPAFCHLTGYQQSEVVGKSLQLIRSDKHEPAFFSAIKQQLTQSGCWSGEVWNRSKDANVIPMTETIYTFCENGNQISHFITTLVDKSEAHDAQVLINYLASRDSLTGLANRLSAQSYFEAAAFEQKQALKKIAVVCLGLDRFKDVNDALGRGVGDQLLIRVAGYLTHMVADNGIVSRSGGDEFLVILRDVRDIVQLSALMQQMVSGIDTVKMAEHTNLSVTTSIGVAVFPDDAFNFDTLLKYADIALHSSKSAGGNQYCIFSPELETKVQQRLQMESCLRTAVQQEEFALVYQPKVCLQTGNITGLEALVRWHSPVLGLVSPADFIPLAERSGLILLVDEWVVANVGRQIRQWLDNGLNVPAVSVNLSTLQFHRGDLQSLILNVLSENNIAASYLDLEITEGVLMETMHSAVSILQGLRDIGVSVSLDDFGTGYSSLSYLKNLPINTLKIDKSFIDDINQTKGEAVIVQAIISLGQSMGLKLVAEGVEYQQQVDYLKKNGCDAMQGYFFSKPLPAAELERMLGDYALTPEC
ncbi:sensor domain-containing protein [Rheinheimera sp. EpRS3]|uniref:sensor domain-containing protein n=1 Tax=Rheinheimera sp. EpRS3 TaxID=1712383 RepID=UPI00074B2F01|nr:EAL domain-containing protein [Rheinheimera sp. EpRS3]KUM53645.1 hypothetical protein AR688_18415 [Rheinheimera sp. EpRS3]